MTLSSMLCTSYLFKNIFAIMLSSSNVKKNNMVFLSITKRRNHIRSRKVWFKNIEKRFFAILSSSHIHFVSFTSSMKDSSPSRTRLQAILANYIRRTILLKKYTMETIKLVLWCQAYSDFTIIETSLIFLFKSDFNNGQDHPASPIEEASQPSLKAPLQLVVEGDLDHC